MLLCGQNYINPIHFLLVFGINHQHVLSYNPVLRPHIFSVKKVMGLSLFCGEKEAVSFCDVSVF